MVATSARAQEMVVDEDDERSTKALLGGLHCAGRGVVVATARPHAGTLTDTAELVLAALGKDLDAPGQGRNAEERWRRAIAWLAAEKVDHFVVWRAHLLTPIQWQHLIDAANQASCNLTLLLAGTGPTAAQAAIRERWDVSTISMPEWLARHDVPASAVVPMPVGFPDVPLSHFIIFRAACRDHLAPLDFARVDDVFLIARDATEEWLAARPLMTGDCVATHLWELIRTASCLSEVVTRLAGAQVALFLAGWLVKVDHEVLAVTALFEPFDQLTADTAQRLRRYANPRYSAGATLALLMRCDTDVLLTLTVGDVAADGASVVHEGSPLPVPAPFQGILRALRLDRLLEGADEQSPLFSARATSSSEEQQAARGLLLILKTVVRDTGVLVTSALTTRHSASTQLTWGRRRGLEITQLVDHPAHLRLVA